MRILNQRDYFYNLKTNNVKNKRKRLKKRKKQNKNKKIS